MGTKTTKRAWFALLLGFYFIIIPFFLQRFGKTEQETQKCYRLFWVWSDLIPLPYHCFSACPWIFAYFNQQYPPSQSSEKCASGGEVILRTMIRIMQSHLD
jgi:hypothetical protein